MRTSLLLLALVACDKSAVQVDTDLDTQADADSDSGADTEADTEDDTEPDTQAPDRDNDGCADAVDAFPDDPTECVDGDDDGVGANADCDDANAALSDNLSVYADTDGDGFGAGDPQAVCALQPPDGAVIDGSDCAPDDSAHWADCGLCTDTDTDDYGTRCDLGTDCDDADPFNWASCASCADADGDGVFVDCDAYSMGPDCAPSDPRHWADCGSCVDQDADGYGVMCDLGTDCDDADIDNWGSCETCLDVDNDGFFVGCDAFTTRMGGDCAPAEPTVFPGASEVCEDGFVNDCDSDVSVDSVCIQERCGVISEDETWPAADYLVTCDIRVFGPTAPTLTIEDGARLFFEPGVAMQVGLNGSGSLVVDGRTAGVLFTSASDQPMAGDWQGVHLARFNQGSTLEGLTLEFAGQRSGDPGGLWLDDSDLLLRNSAVFDNEGHGLFTSGDIDLVVDDVFFAGNALDGLHIETDFNLSGGVDLTNVQSWANGRYGVSIPAQHAHELGPDTLLADPLGVEPLNADARVHLNDAVVPSTASWPAHSDPYFAEQGVLVSSNSRLAVLTLQAGVMIEMGADTRFRVAQTGLGGLTTQGTPLDPVVVRSAADSPAAGDWLGLEVGRFSSDTELVGLTVRHGGGGASEGCVTLRDAEDVRIQGGVVSDCWGSGVYVSGDSEPRISECLIQDVQDYAVSVVHPARLYRDPVDPQGSPSFYGNTLERAGVALVDVPAHSASEIASDNVFDPLPGAGGVFIEGNVGAGTVSEDSWWRAISEPFVLRGDVTLTNNVGGTATLTLEPSVTLRMNDGVHLWAGVNGVGDVVANGTADAPVVFTANSDTPERGDWDELRLGRFSTGSLLRHTVVQWAGGGIAPGCVHINGSEPVIEDTRVSQCLGDAVYAANVSGGGVAPSFLRTTFEGASDYGLRVDDGTTGLASLAASTFQDNGLNPLWVPVADVAAIAADNDFDVLGRGNGEQAVLVGTQSTSVNTNATWADLGVAYQLRTSVNVVNNTGADPTLTLGAGAVLHMEPDTELRAGVNGLGSLRMAGTVDAPVIVRSAAEAPMPGDWLGVRIGRFSFDSELVQADLAHGGGGGQGAVWVNETTATLNGVVLRAFEACGLDRTGSATVDATDVSFVDGAGPDLCP